MEDNNLILGAGGNSVKDFDPNEAQFDSQVDSLDRGIFVDPSGDLKVATIRDVIAIAQVNAFHEGFLVSPLTTTATPTSVKIFDHGFYSSSAIITSSPDLSGFTINAPLKFIVTVIGTTRTSGNTDFFAQIYAGGVAIGKPTDVSGDGNSKAVNFSIRAITHLLTVGDKIEVRIWDSGEMVNQLDLTIDVTYAGE